MPSLLHEGIIALVRERPELAADLLRELLHVSLPAFTEARLAEASLNDLVPTEYRADAVVLLVDSKPVFGIILEAQLKVDPDKPFTWPMYAVSARARFRCSRGRSRAAGATPNAMLCTDRVIPRRRRQKEF